MHYQGRIIRPPNEAESILLQVALGCPHNSCAFCGAYLGEAYQVKDESRVFADIDYAARNFSDQRRLFLCGGDGLAMPFARLARVLERIRLVLPRVARVGAYASAASLGGKSLEELRALKDLGLSTVYMGLESGSESLLAAMGKKTTAAQALTQAQRVREAGLKLSVTVIVGLGGAEGWQEHARLTGQALSAMAPDQAAALCLIPVPGTRLWQDIKAGRFVLPDGPGLVRELRLMLEHTDMPRGLFLADHASNLVPLRLRMPRDKARGLALLDAALAGDVPLKPDKARRL